MKRSILLGLALGVALAVQPAHAGERAEVEPLLQTIERLRHEGDVQEAARRAEELVASHPDSLEAHVAHQDTQLALGHREELVESYRSRARADDASADDRYLYARLLSGATAVGELKGALALDADHFWTHCALGSELLAQGRESQAAEALDRARELRPDSAVPVNLLGRAAEARGDVEEAERLYRGAVEIDGDLVLARVNLGVLLVGSGRHEDALSVLDEAVRRAPRMPAALLGRGAAHFAAGSLESAALDYRTASELDGNDIVALDLLANTYLNMERYDEAETALRKALVLDADHGPTHVFLAYLHLARGEVSDAEAATERALDADPSSPEARYMLGLCFERAGSPKKAEAEYRRAQKLAPRDPVYVRALALLFESQARWRDAVREYEKVVKMTGGTTDSLFELALAQWSFGKHDRVERTFETLLENDPGHLDSWLNLGALRQRHTRDRKGAREAYQEYLARGGRDERVHLWLRELDD